jgi:hypothetical protein
LACVLYNRRCGAAAFESLDCVLDELYDERRSMERTDAGVREVLGVIGDLELPLPCVDNVWVSRVNAEPFTLLLASFFEEGFRRWKTDFQECELGLCGEVGVCMLALVGDRAWRINGGANGMERLGEEDRTRTKVCKGSR